MYNIMSRIGTNLQKLLLKCVIRYKILHKYILYSCVFVRKYVLIIIHMKNHIKKSKNYKHFKTVLLKFTKKKNILIQFRIIL